MRSIKYCLTKEPPYYVAQCLNVEVSSFGESVEEAVQNLREAVELYFEDNSAVEYREIAEVMIGESVVNAWADSVPTKSSGFSPSTVLSS